jgi:hypothetical protein
MSTAAARTRSTSQVFSRCLKTLVLLPLALAPVGVVLACLRERLAHR